MGLQKPWSFESPSVSPWNDDVYIIQWTSQSSSATQGGRFPLLPTGQTDPVFSGFGNMPPWNERMSVAKHGKDLQQRRSKLGRKPTVNVLDASSTPSSRPATPTHGKENTSRPESTDAPVKDARNHVLGINHYRPRPKPVPAANRIRATSCPIILDSVEDLIALVLPSAASRDTEPTYPKRPNTPTMPKSKRVVSQPLVTIPSTPGFDTDTGSESDDDDVLPPTPQLDENTSLPLVDERKADVTARSQFAFLSPSSPQYTSSPVNPIQRASCLGFAGSHGRYLGPVPSSGDDEMEVTLKTLRKKTGAPDAGSTARLMSRYTRKPIPTWN